MRKNFVVLLVLVVALSAIFACKSVETTSAMLHNDHGQFDLAIEQAQAALAKNPNDAEAHFQLGVAYSNTKKMREAYDEFTAAAQLDPKGKLENAENNIRSNWARHFNNGVAEYQSDNFAGASMEFEQTVASDPRKIKGWLNLAKAYTRVSEDDSTYLEKAFSVADTLLAKVTKEDDEYGDVLALSGRLLIIRGDKEAAFGIFEKLIIDDPANFDILEGVGADLMGEGDFANAALFLELASDGRLKTDSEDFDLYYNLGVCYNKSENYLKSVEAYHNAIMIKGDEKNVNYALLLTYYEGELYDEAIMQGQNYTEMFPADPRGWQVLSLSFNKKGMKIMAEEAFKKYQEVTGQ